MKVTNEQYAKLLYEASKADESERKKLLKGVAGLIKENGDINKIGDIENRYLSLKKKYSGEMEGVVYSVRKLDENQLGKIKKAVAENKGISSKLIVLKNEIDPEMKGGFVVKFENEILDGSLDNKITRVKKALVG